MRRSLPATRVAVALVVCSMAMAAAPAVVPPDDRIDVTVTPEGGEDSARVGIDADVGARAHDTAVEVSPGGIEVENPPMADALVVDEQGPRLRGEELYGPRDANASLGTGGITANVDGDGRLSGLNWPSPGYYDHMAYLNTTRDVPRQGHAANAGAFGGILGHGWLTSDFGWRQVSQTWAAPDAGTLRTVLRNDDLDLAVTITDVVHPTKDVVARSFEFSRPLEAPFVYYANMNPTTTRTPRVPSTTDALADPALDFATVHAEADGANLHFRPYTIDPASTSRIATSQPDAGTATDAVAGSFGSGVYVAVAGQQRPVDFQAGLEADDLVRGEAEGTPLLDPYRDALDGDLSESPAAFGMTAGALALSPDRDGRYTVYTTAGDTPGDALALVRDARRQGFRSVSRQADHWWRDWLAGARLPATQDQQTLNVSRRALMLIRTAQDRQTGAIVANTTAQTPYREDWVRDGAFFSYALLLAGYDEMALQHSEFYRRIYRIGGTWDSFYYTDGGEAGAIFPYEIDSQAFALWALWLPYEFEAGGPEYLESVWPAIQDTANALLACTDPTSGLQCPAPEDDAYLPSQGAQGASTVYLAFRSAVAAAEALGVEPNPRWAERADEIRQATLEQLCDDEGCQGGRGGIYLVWPSRLLDPDDPETAELAQRHLRKYVRQLDQRASFEQPAVGGFFQYPMESILALANGWSAEDRTERMRGWLTWLTHDVVEPGVLHYAERIYRDGPRSYLHTVGFPHIWSGAETYLAAAFVEGLTKCRPGRAIGNALPARVRKECP